MGKKEKRNNNEKLHDALNYYVNWRKLEKKEISRSSIFHKGLWTTYI
jgi:hypothetical protein